MNWRGFLKPDEAQRLIELDAIRSDATAERKRIWDRCRKRMSKENAK